MPEPIIAIITARGGSKRIPRKNIRPFLGEPILAYSIKAAFDSGLFGEIMISTDDMEIASVAAKYGANVPFLRSEKASGDFATTSDALLDVFTSYKEQGQEFEYACCLYPTAPFVTGKKLIEAYNKLISEKADTIFPVMPFSAPVFRSLKFENGKLEMIWKQYRDTRSQDLPQAYHDAGQFYFFNVPAFMKNRSLISDNVCGVVIEEIEGQDIDTLTDWELAELKYQLLQKDNKA